MSFSEKLNKSLDARDLKGFTELANHPELLINDIFDRGLLHHLLEKYGTLPIEFFRVVVENINTDVNRIGRNKLPPILSTERSDIQDLLLSLPKTNLDVLINKEEHMRLINAVLKVGDMELFTKLLKHPRIDLLQRGLALNEDMTLLNYSMKNNMEAFRLLLADGTRIDPNRSGLYNAVQYAVKTLNLEAFEMLIKRGATFNTIIRDIPLIEYLTESTRMSHMKMLDLLLNTHFEGIDNKKGLFLKSIAVENTKVFIKFLEYGVAVDESTLKLILEKQELAKILMFKIQSITIDQNLLANYIFKSGNKELLDILASSPIIDNIRGFMITYLLECENAKSIVQIMESNMDYLIRNNLLKRVLLGNDAIVFNILINGGEGAYLDELLKRVPDLEIPSDFKQIGSVIFRERYDLLDTLLNKYNVCVTSVDNYKTLIAKNRLDLVTAALEVCSEHNPDVLTNYTFVMEFYHRLPARYAIELLINERLSKNIVKDMVFGRLLKIDGFPELLEQYTDLLVGLYEEGKLSYGYIDWLFNGFGGRVYVFTSAAEATNTPIFRMLTRNAEGINYFRRIFGAMDGVYDKKPSIEKVFAGILAVGDIELFTRVFESINLENIDIIIDKFLYINPNFMMRNIDEILRLIPDLYIKFAGSLVDLMDGDIGLYDSSDIARKLFTASGENFIVGDRIDERLLSRISWDESEWREDEWIEAGTKYTQLTEILLSHIHEDTPKSPKGDAIVRLFKTCVETTDININQKNVDTDTYTVLEWCVSQIKRYSNDVDYTSPETNGYLQQIIQYLLSNEHINLMSSTKLISLVIRQEDDVQLGDLVTTIISHPTMDINGLYVIFDACSNKNLQLLQLLLTIGTLDVNLYDGENKVPLHICIEKNFTEGALALLADSRIDTSILDAKGRNFARLANKANMREVSQALAAIGLTDDKQARLERQIAEYDARMAELGRVKQARIRETLNSFDLILKEERVQANREDIYHLRTPYGRTACPFCLTYLEKEAVHECVYLSGHTCPRELENEALKRVYFGDNWETARFEICCVCGRPGSHHGHYKLISDASEGSEILPGLELVSHWDCDDKNGGGGREEMIARIVGMLTEIKRRVDSDERLVYGPELILELATIGNRSANNEETLARARDILERKKWNANSKIEKFVKFNAPLPAAAEAAAAANNTSNRPANVREPIVHYDNTVHEDEDDRLQCTVCLDPADNLFKPHESDLYHICDVCIKRLVCASPYGSVTCVLGCNPKKQIHKDDVDALMGGNFCAGVAIVHAAANN